MPTDPHRCGVCAEPLHRYTAGGYYPVHLGDVLKNGRYKIIHKLGWGGYATVWAARDLE
jgi:serine/threonine-protein kinase SRPK3